MNGFDHSSLSSYGEPRHYSAASVDPPKPPPAKILLDGYRNALDPQNEKSSRYNPVCVGFISPVPVLTACLQLNPSHPRSSALLNASDPVVMYLLSETAIGDSKNYEVLSLEEVEDLKKEYNFLAGRLDASKRKLALEMKLRDAAKSLSRLYNPKSPRSSEEFDPSGSPKSRRNRLSMFGRNSSDRSDEELATATRKCEDVALEVWKLEHRTQHIQKRLLEHTAGVLQMTHKGLKKGPKSNLPRTPESIYSGNTRGSVDGFDDRSLYRTLDDLNEFGGSDSTAVGIDAIQNTERKLEMLSGRLHDMALQSYPDGELDPVPQPSNNPTATVDAHLTYIENTLGLVGSYPGASHAVPDQNTEQQLAELSTQLHDLMLQSGLSRSPAVPPPDPNSGLQEKLIYLGAVVGSLQTRVDGLLDQKSILTTQIQQQRELNSKSDAEKDVHAADLLEQVATIKKELELSERENQSSKEQLELALEQLEGQNNDPHALDSEKEARARAEQDVLRLQAIVDQHGGNDARAEEANEARERAEKQILELEAAMEQLRTESDARVKEATDMHAAAGSDVPRLEAEMEELHAQLKDATEARSRAEEDSARKQTELTEREGEVAMAQTELTMAKAELDGAYGSRAQRAAEVASNPAVQKEIDDLNAKNIELTEELAGLKAGTGGGDLQQRVQTLEKELRETTDEYEAMTKASIEFEKDRERLDGVIDSLRERCEQLETQISEDRISNMGVSSPTSSARDGTSETTSTMVLKNEFKKMMKDTRIENMKILKVSQQSSVYSYSVH